MPITPTYPGVYIEEVPSGVRTITGVSTSVAVFIGRARRGPMNTPTLCLNYSDFERTFSSDYGGSEMARSVLLFFQNGGTQCYAMRIAEGATASEVTLRSETGVEVLLVRSKSPGLLGDSIRMAVTYNGLDPESTFNLEVFRWGTGSGGQAVKEATEKWQSLSMDPTSPRYAQQFVNQNSNLINLDDLNVAPSASGYSQSGRAIPSRTNTIFRGQMVDLIGAASVAGSNRFRIGVDGGTFVEANLSAIDFSQAPLDTVTNIRTNLAAAIKAAIDPVLTGGAQVEVSFETGHRGQRSACWPGDRPIEDHSSLFYPRLLIRENGLEIKVGTFRAGQLPNALAGPSLRWFRERNYRGDSRTDSQDRRQSWCLEGTGGCRSQPAWSGGNRESTFRLRKRCTQSPCHKYTASFSQRHCQLGCSDHGWRRRFRKRIQIHTGAPAGLIHRRKSFSWHPVGCL